MPRDAKSDPAGIPLAPRDFLILLILAEGPTHGYGVVTVFTVADHLFLRALPYPEADRLVFIERGSYSYPIVRQLDEFTSISGWAPPFSTFWAASRPRACSRTASSA